MPAAPMNAALTFRRAQPADADAAVPLIYSSGPAAFDFVFSHARQGTPLDYLRRAYLDGSGEFGWRNHVVMCLDGRLAGIGAGYTGRTALPFMLAAAGQIFGQYGLLSAPGVIVRGLRVEAVIPPPTRSDQLYLAHLGVRPELRGQGLGSQLMAHLLERGREAGLRQAALDVSVENPRAQALYERWGFKVVRQRASRLSNHFAAVPGHRRMECSLQAF